MSASPYYLDWYEDRAKLCRWHLREQLDPDTKVWTPIDISASTAKVYLRAWKGPTLGRQLADALLNVEMTKVTDGTGGDPALVSVTATIVSGSGRVGPIELELVLVDEAATGQPTPSTYRERELWYRGSADGARLLPTLQP